MGLCFSTLLDIDKLTPLLRYNDNRLSFSTLLDIDKLTHDSKTCEMLCSFSTLLDIDNNSIIRYIFFCSATTCHL